MAGRMWHSLGALSVALSLACSSGRSGTEATSGTVTGADSTAVLSVRACAQPIRGDNADYDALLAMAADARVVFLGEQTHGTHEFYSERARITRRLILERGFRAIALEADWPEVERVNRYIHGLGTDRSAAAALGGFTDFPVWMWRNTDMRDLVDWLRTYNAALPPAQRVSIFGLDVYSLFESADAVIAYLETVDPAAAARAREQYTCFASSRPDPQRYGASADTRSCRAQAATVLAELRKRTGSGSNGDAAAVQAAFSALRNAHAVVNSEEYFRSLYAGGVSTWNLRDQRMEETIVAIDEHLSAVTGEPARIVAWAHNTHAGDARATESAEGGELNVGQLVRQRLGDASLLVGFFTYHGTVMAAPRWGEPGRVYDVRPALRGSYADLFRSATPGNFLLMLRNAAAAEPLSQARLERAIGVIYSPSTERQSHYFLAHLAQQFDAVIFLDRTTAVTPLR